MPSDETGLFIGFSGLDGAGKSTQLQILYEWLREHGVDTVLYEETRHFVPEISFAMAKRHGVISGSAYMGEDRYITAVSFDVLAQTMLKIRPFTSIGKTVITPRTAFDWLAGARSRGCSPETYQLAEEVMLFGGRPDLTIWIDTAPDVAYDRLQHRAFSVTPLKTLLALRTGFQEVSERYSLPRVDGNGSVENVHRSIIEVVSGFLSSSGHHLWR